MSCLFQSLSYFLKTDDFYIRQKICNYLEANEQIIDGLDTKLILDIEDPDYIRKMRSTTTWGGSIELAAACNIWNMKINVYLHNRANKVIEFLPKNGSYVKIANIIWYGNHYEPLTVNVTYR